MQYILVIDEFERVFSSFSSLCNWLQCNNIRPKGVTVYPMPSIVAGVPHKRAGEHS